MQQQPRKVRQDILRKWRNSIINFLQGNYTKFLKNLHTEQLAKLQLKNQHECDLLEDIRTFVIKRSAIEKQYSEALLKVSSSYLNKKTPNIPEIKLDGADEKWWVSYSSLIMRNFPFICSKEYFVKSEKTHKLLPSITYNLTSKFIIEECYGRGVLKTTVFFDKITECYAFNNRYSF